mgnify:CR=1 FL=1
MLFSSCAGAKEVQKNDNNIKKIKKVSEKRWITFEELEELIKLPQKMHVIFASPRCNACNYLRKAIANVGLSNRVIYINVDEGWGNGLAQQFEIRGVPELIVTDVNKNIVQKVAGPGDILLFLVLYSDVSY